MLYHWLLRYFPAPIAWGLTALVATLAVLVLCVLADVNQAEVRYLQF